MKTRDLPGISVLLPVYFRHISVENIRLLRGSLESVVGQRYSGPLEILVIDDGSPCPVESFAEDLGAVAKMVRWIRLPYNRGIVFALNAGIETARHDFLARIDADDRWLPGKLDVQIEQLLADPDLTLIATGMTRVNADGTVLDTHIRPGDWSGILRFFIEQGCPFPHGSVIGKRQVYRILGGYPHTAAVRHCEDYALWEIWLRFFKPAMVESALYEYRVSGTSVSVEHSLQQFRAAEVIRRRFALLDLVDVLPTVLPEFAKILGCSLFDVGVIAYLMWGYRASFSFPVAAQTYLTRILPDRVVDKTSTALPWWMGLGFSEGERQKNSEYVSLIANPF